MVVVGVVVVGVMMFTGNGRRIICQRMIINEGERNSLDVYKL